MSKKIIITIPAYNEEKTLGSVLEEIKKVMSKTKYDYKLMVYNDGSTDKTAEVAQKYEAIVFSHKRNLGLAITFQDELKEILKMDIDVIVHTDADGQYKADGIPRLLAKIDEGYDLVLGSRFKGKIEGMPFLKKLGNMAFAKVLSTLTKTKLTDTTTGFRAFTKEVAERIEFINSFTYTQEQIIKASKHGFTIIEVPIDTRKTRESRLFKNPLQYAIKAWINIFRIYRDFDPIKFFGGIGLFFLIAGIILGAFIVGRIIFIGSAGGTPRVILSALLMFTGIQIILFGFLADMQRR